jgi:hypothetical protein
MGFLVVRPYARVSALLLVSAVANAGYDSHVGIESAHLYGNINKYAYYFTDLLIGSPVPQRTSVIVDTGSRLVGFPCTGCAHCGPHLEPAFDVAKSDSAKWLGCQQDCSATCYKDHCPYSETYSEGSSISGFWFTDFVELGESSQRNPPVRAELGCHSKENKLFYSQRANGIMGLAPSQFTANRRPTVLQDLFRDKAHVDTRVFAICLATWGGQLTIGGFNASYHVTPGGDGVTWIDMRVSQYYFIFPEGISVGGEAGARQNLVAVGKEAFGVTIVDSGTTYTYFPEEVYKKLIDHLDRYCERHGGCGARRIDSECFRLGPGVGPVLFPPLRFLFGGVEISWEADGYLQQRGEPGMWCQAFKPHALFQTVLGISWIIHNDIIFDIARSQLGVAKAHCPEHHYDQDFNILNEASMDGLVARGTVVTSSSANVGNRNRTSIELLVVSALIVTFSASVSGWVIFRFFAERETTASTEQETSDLQAEPALGPERSRTRRILSMFVKDGSSFSEPSEQEMSALA